MKRTTVAESLVGAEILPADRDDPDTTLKDDHSDGFALVLVLVAVALLALMMETVLVMANHGSERASDAGVHAQLLCAADSVVNEAILTLVNQTGMRWPQDGSPRVVRFGGFEVSVSIQSEAGKVDINRAPRQLIFGLFTAAGLNQAQANVMADRVLDWREPGELKRLNGAKTEDYVAAGLAYRPRLGPFETIDELRLVLGMTPAVYNHLSDGITVYSIIPGPQLQTAPPIVLSAVGLNKATIQEVTSERARGEVAPYGELMGPYAVSRIAGLPTTTFTISAKAKFENQIVTRTEIVRFTGEPQNPFLILGFQ